MEAVPTRPQWVEDDHPAMGELWTVRTRSVKELRRDPLDPVPELARRAEELFGITPDKPKTEKVFAILNAALPFLDNDEQRRSVHKLFDLSGNRGSTPLYRRLAAAADEVKPGMSAETFTDNRDKGGQYEQNLIRAVGQIVLALHHHLRGPRLQLRPAARYSGSQSASSLEYVERPAMSDAFKQALAEGHPIIQLAGDVGVGKTRLAKELCLRHADGEAYQVVFLATGYDGKFYRSGMADALSERGLDIRGYSDEAVAAHFSGLMASEQAPKFVVLDGVTDFGVVNTLIPAGLRSILVITCTEVADGAHVIAVPPMEDDEARSLAGQLLDNASEEDIAEVVEHAERRPRFINTSATMLVSKRYESAKQLAEDIKSSPSLFFEMAEPSWRDRVTTHYSQVLERLRIEYPAAGRVLEAISLYKYGWFEPAELTELIAGLLRLDEGAVRSKMAEDIHFRLRAHSLVSVTDRGHIRTNKLTSLIISDLLGARKDEILDELHDVIDASLKRYSLDRDADGFNRWQTFWYGFKPGGPGFNPFMEPENKWSSFPDYPEPIPRPEPPVMAAGLPKDYSDDPTHRALSDFAFNVYQLYNDLEAVNQAVAAGTS